MSITKSLEKAIRTMATQIAHDSPFDKTRSGVVTGYNASENKYNIIVDGVRYSNIPIVNGLMAKVNDVVKVALPNGNVSQMFIYGVQTSYSTLVGEIKPYAGNIEPNGWMICDGRAISRSDYQTLFSVIGTTYGVGDGTTTFNIPNLAGRTLIGASNNYPLADAQGEATHVLEINEIPSHNHGQEVITGGFKVRRYGTSGTGAQIVYTPSGIVSISTDSTSVGKINQGGVSGGLSEDVTITATHTHNSNGGGLAHNNMQPYLAINYLIHTGGVTF